MPQNKYYLCLLQPAPHAGPGDVQGPPAGCLGGGEEGGKSLQGMAARALQGRKAFTGVIYAWL